MDVLEYWPPLVVVWVSADIFACKMRVPLMSSPAVAKGLVSQMLGPSGLALITSTLTSLELHRRWCFARFAEIANLIPQCSAATVARCLFKLIRLVRATGTHKDKSVWAVDASLFLSELPLFVFLGFGESRRWMVFYLEQTRTWWQPWGQQTSPRTSLSCQHSPRLPTDSPPLQPSAQGCDPA